MNNTHFQRDLSHRNLRTPTVIDLADRLGVVGETLIVYPWFDPVVDASGQPMCGAYVEQFWLGVLGPTATWLARRLVGGFDHYPDGYELNLPDTAAELGVTFRTDEVQSICPVTNQPDISSVSIEYEPDRFCIESKSLKLYFWSFRDRAVFAEALAAEIAGEVMHSAQPHRVTVTLTQRPRGGIEVQAIAELSGS